MVRTISEAVSVTTAFFGMSGQQVFSLSSLRDQVDYAGLTGLVKKYAPSRLREIGDSWFQRGVSAGVTGLETAASRSQTFNRIVTNGKTLGVLDFARRDPFSAALVIILSIVGIVQSVKGLMNFFNKNSSTPPKDKDKEVNEQSAPNAAGGTAGSNSSSGASLPRVDQTTFRSGGQSAGGEMGGKSGSGASSFSASSMPVRNKQPRGAPRPQGGGNVPTRNASAGQGGRRSKGGSVQDLNDFPIAVASAPSPAAMLPRPPAVPRPLAMPLATSGSGLIEANHDNRVVEGIPLGSLVASTQMLEEGRSFTESPIASDGNGDSIAARGLSPSNAAGGEQPATSDESGDD